MRLAFGHGSAYVQETPGWLYGAAIGLALLLGVIVAIAPLAAVGLLLALGYILYALKKPIINVYVVIAATVLTSGMARGALIPMLIPNEPILLGAAALALPYILLTLWRSARLPRTLLFAILALIVGTVIIPLTADYLRGFDLGISTIFNLAAPLQYVLLFMLCKYLVQTDAERRRVVWLLIGMSLIVAAVGLLQALRVNFVLQLLTHWYPSDQTTTALSLGRVTSLLSAWNALGAFLMVNLLIARTLLLRSAGETHKRLLLLICAVIIACMLASGSFASAIGLAIGFLMIEAYDERFHVDYLVFFALAILVTYLVLGPLISERLAYQSRNDSVVPETLTFRFQVWGEVFLPALQNHILWGVQPEIPSTAGWQWAENHYLFLLYRGGIFAVLGHLAWVALTLKWLFGFIRRNTGISRSIAISAATILVVLSIMGLTNEVFTFSGVNEYVWILLGIAAGSETANWRPRRVELSQHYAPLVDVPTPEEALADIRSRIPASDWSMISGSFLLTVGTMIGRVLGLAFSLVLARALAPDVFGAIQYAIALAGVLAIGTQPFGQHVLARFAARYRGEPDALRSYLTNAWVVLVGLFAVTLAIVLPLSTVFHQIDLGVLVMFAGITLFYTYWGFARGYEASFRLMVAYIGSNLVQIIAVVFVIQVMQIKSALLAEIIYGASYVLPLVLLQVFAPIPTSFFRHAVSWDVTKALLRFSIPVWISHASYMLFTTLDVMLLEHFRDTTSVGIFSLIKTLSMIFTFVPMSVSTILLPRIASVPDEQHNRLLRSALLWSVVINSAVLVVFMLLAPWFVTHFASEAYVITPDVTLVLALSMIGAGLVSVFTAVLVGRAQTVTDMLYRGLGLGVAFVAGFILVPRYGMVGAAATTLIGNAVMTVAYAVLFVRTTRRFARFTTRRRAPKG